MDARTKLKSEYEKAVADLDVLEKSQKEGTELTPDQELDVLLKSLEAEIGDPLKKSEDDVKDPDDDKDDKGADPDPMDDDELEKSIRLAAEAEALRKAQDLDLDPDYDELVKASECYIAMTESIQKSHGDIKEQLGTMCKSMTALMNLNVKMAGVITMQSGELTALKKSREEDLDTLQKSLATLGAKPVMPNKAVLGIGEREKHEEAMQKSVPEVKELLLKSIHAGKVDSRWLSIFDTYKDVAKLSAEVRETIGV